MIPFKDFFGSYIIFCELWHSITIYYMASSVSRQDEPNLGL